MVDKVSFHFLKSGDRIEVIAPSSAVAEDVVKNSVAFIQSWGLKPNVRYPSEPNHPLYSGEDAQRFENLKAALSSAAAKVIWVLRGGSGATRLIPRLSAWARCLSSPPPYKLLIGFSDVTALHTFFIQEWGWPTLHGPNLGGLAGREVDEWSAQALKQILHGEQQVLEETNLVPLNEEAQQKRTIEAPIVGGNHSVLQYSIGTPWQLDCRDKILFLEDVNEQAYRMNERLEHFLQARLFDGVRAILLGDFSYTPDHTQEDPHKIDYVLRSFAERLTVPVFRMPGYGHVPTNKPLLMGVTARLETGKTPKLVTDFKILQTNFFRR